MTDLAGRTVRAPAQVSVEHECRSEPGADAEVRQVAAYAMGQQGGRPDGGGVHVVLHEHRQPEPALELGRQRERGAVEVEVDRVPDRTEVDVDQPGHADADRPQLSRGLRSELGDHLDRGGEYAVGSRAGGDTDLGLHLAQLVGQHAQCLRGPDVEPDPCRVGHPVHPRSRRISAAASREGIEAPNVQTRG
jgi:hypothetical protein